MLIEVSVVCYQPSCHKCFYIAVVLKHVVAKIFAAALGTNDSLSETNFNDIITVPAMVRGGFSVQHARDYVC
jgi:hypothetical protein